VNLSGGVEVIHKPDSNGGQPFNLRGQSLTAELEPDPAAATRPAKATTESASLFTGSGGADADPGKMRLRRVSVHDNVHVESNNLKFDAHDLSYDPIAQILTANGDENNPVVVFDNKDGSSTTASELQWNTKTDQFKIKKLGGKVRR
jgi:hypothetical protein